MKTWINSITYFTLVISLCSFVAIPLKKLENIKKITIEINMPNVVLNTKGEFISMQKEIFSIYYLNKFIVYEFPAYAIDSVKKVSFSENKGYFVYEKNNKYGILYPIYNANGSKQLVDSVLRLRAFIGNDKFFEYTDTTFIRKSISINGIQEEVSIPKFVKGRTFPDTIYHYYSHKLDNIEYSFSRKVDKTMQSKFFKYKGVFNTQQYQGDTIKLPRREFLVEMKEDIVTDDNKETIARILNKYSKNPN